MNTEFKKLVLEKLKDEDVRWFYSLYNGDGESYEEDEGKSAIIEKAYKDSLIKSAYYFNGGDGNDLIICIKLTFGEDDVMYIQMEGTYSSWDTTYMDVVYEAEPYEFKETRYKKKEN